MERFLPKEVYKHENYEKNIGIKNFFQFYRDYVDKEALKYHKSSYLAKIHKVEKAIESVDFRKDLMFFSEKNVSREIWLCGFMKLDSLVSNYRQTFLQLYEMFWRNDSDETLTDIHQKVYCLYMDTDMYSPKNDDILTTLITNRDTIRDKNGESLYNWVFYRGTIQECKEGKYTAKVYDFFRKRENAQIIDLNNSVILDIDNKNNVPQRIKSRPIIENSQDLGEIY